MATQIIAALRHHAPRLRGNTFLIATELAHRMNGQGYGRVAYRYLASKAHCCKQTAITHIAKLLDLGLIRRSRSLTTEGYGWNLYIYCGPRVHSASPPAKTRCPKVGQTLPHPEERAKELSLREDLERQKKGLRFYTPGSEQWHITCEEIARLEALVWQDEASACEPAGVEMVGT